MRSLGRIIEPFAELQAQPRAGQQPSRLAAWALRRARFGVERRTYDIVGKTLKAHLPSFDSARFLATQQEEYEAVLRCVSTGAWAKLKPLVTEQAFVAIRRGAEAGVAEFGARQGAKVVQWVIQPAIVGAAPDGDEGLLRHQRLKLRPGAR
jgi:hypothetical protein